MNRISLSACLAGILLVACQSPVGGPCEYRQDTIEAQVLDSDEGIITFQGPETLFRVPVKSLGVQPTSGETVRLLRERIISGTCTPVIYSMAN